MKLVRPTRLGFSAAELGSGGELPDKLQWIVTGEIAVDWQVCQGAFT